MLCVSITLTTGAGIGLLTGVALGETIFEEAQLTLLLVSLFGKSFDLATGLLFLLKTTFGTLNTSFGFSESLGTDKIAFCLNASN